MIDAQTEYVAIFGNPVAHSLAFSRNSGEKCRNGDFPGKFFLYRTRDQNQIIAATYHLYPSRNTRFRTAGAFQGGHRE